MHVPSGGDAARRSRGGAMQLCTHNRAVWCVTLGVGSGDAVGTFGSRTTQLWNVRCAQACTAYAENVGESW
jgi:hypothetical protein